MQEIWHSFVSGIWALFLPVIIIGGFRSGLFTPTEAGAVAAFYALFVATVIYREMTFAHFGMCSLAQRKRPQW